MAQSFCHEREKKLCAAARQAAIVDISDAPAPTQPKKAAGPFRQLAPIEILKKEIIDEAKADGVPCDLFSRGFFRGDETDTIGLQDRFLHLPAEDQARLELLSRTSKRVAKRNRELREEQRSKPIAAEPVANSQVAALESHLPSNISDDGQSEAGPSVPDATILGSQIVPARLRPSSVNAATGPLMISCVREPTSGILKLLRTRWGLVSPRQQQHNTWTPDISRGSSRNKLRLVKPTACLSARL